MAQKSGRYWVTWANVHAVNSKDLDDLDAAFRDNVKAFIEALEAAGAKVTVSATRRNPKRAYLFHWAWEISQSKCQPAVPDSMAGVDIEWDHGDAAKSRAGALEMVTGFGLAVPPACTNPPALTSNHISGKAVDMTITWTGSIKVKKKDGTEVSVTYAANANANSILHAVGDSYGVRKLKTDAPHWSDNGR